MRLNRLALRYPLRKNLRGYFSLKYLKTSFLNAIFLSAFIFLNILENSSLNVLGLIAFIYGALRLIFCALKERDFALIIWSQTGFFMGIFWFYWMSFSLIYYDFAYLIPVEIFGIGAIYSLIFTIFCALGFLFFHFFKITLKALKIMLFATLFWLIQYIHPFGFNWLNFSLPIINTPFEALFWDTNTTKLPFKIAIKNSSYSQHKLWNKELLPQLKDSNQAFIDNAINDGARLAILPESAFAYTLNYDEQMIKALLEKSQKIAILVGAEALEGGVYYNSAYFFDKGEFRRIDKHILVPFGEEIPLPDFLKKPINAIFFDGASDYSKASDFSYIQIDGAKIKVAICYEGSRYELYEDKPSFVAVISNNAWFRPSSQNTLFELILRYYSLKNHSTIFHAQNK